MHCGRRDFSLSLRDAAGAEGVGTRGCLYAQRHEAAGDEVLLTIDAATLSVKEETVLQTTEVMGSYVSFDPARSRVAFSNPAGSLVSIMELK